METCIDVRMQGIQLYLTYIHMYVYIVIFLSKFAVDRLISSTTLSLYEYEITAAVLATHTDIP
jgi:hypothetical protein